MWVTNITYTKTLKQLSNIFKYILYYVTIIIVYKNVKNISYKFNIYS